VLTASAPTGVAPEAFKECVHYCKVFYSVLLVCKVFVSADLSGAMRTYQHLPTFGACPGGVAVRRAPEPGPTQGDRGKLSDLSIRPFAALPQVRGVRCPRLPSCGSRIMVPRRATNGWFKWTSVPRSIRVGSWSGDTSIRALCAGVLGRARPRSIGTKGAKALPRWDPLTNCPRWP
jgi:DNA-directed RNA polymerase subunit RPC12/RpoP